MLTLYNWGAITVLVFFMALIARFYRKTSGRETFYQWYAVPELFFTGAMVRYASIGRVMGDEIGDVLWFLAGASFLGLCLYLFRLMMQRKVEDR